MNQKELSELRRRFRPDKSAISRVYGCYVNSSREIVSYLDESLGTMPEEESGKYLGLLKKALSGKLGKHLIDIVFSTAQVADSDEHRLLSTLRSTELKDGAVREQFYQTVIRSLNMGESSYLILLACDVYDVPHRGKDDALQADASDEVFRYIVCCVCPVKDGKPELSYFPRENEFHSVAAQIVSAPELGFLFPAFDDRAANIYNALFYARKPDEIHQEFIGAVFRTEPPMSAAEQREAFQTALSEGLEDLCSLEVVQAVHERLWEQMETHRESKSPEPLALTPGEIGAILTDCGVPEERVAAFREKCGQQFGKGAALNPANLIDAKRFEVATADAAITVEPERSYLVETRVIDGRSYLLIPADEGVALNGFPVSVAVDVQQEPEKINSF